MQTVSDTPKSELKKRRVFLPDFLPGRSKTIIFDLDETLVHCVDSPAPSES